MRKMLNKTKYEKQLELIEQALKEKLEELHK
jgi:hypothetical protein